jgi:hypothetical protein
VWDTEGATNDPDTAASVILRLDAKDYPPQAYIMQIPVPSLESQVVYNRELFDNFTMYNCTPVSANATPKGTSIDVHIGMLFRGPTRFCD